MSRLSIRPRPLDFHKKLPVVKSVKDFEDDETPSGTRNAQLLRLVESETEVPQVSSKKLASEIPTPQFVVVDTYERDYSQTFAQPTSYLRARAARAEIGEFIEYDLDNEDDDWLEEFNKERRILSPEKFETILFKLEVSDHKARERAGVIIPTLGPPVPVLLTFDAAVEALQSLSIKYGVFQSIYNYWKEKRERWQKPILRRLQPPPPVNDTNPYNVFRPRERPNRLHTRRMQRRENNVQSFEKLRQVRRNLEQARTVLDALVKREEKKREVMESEVSLQRMQLKYKNETELLEDTLALPGLPSFPTKAISSDEEFVDSDDLANSDPRMRPSAAQNLPFMDSQQGASSSRRRPNGWMHKMDPDEPVMFFTKPLDLEQLAAAGIAPPPAPIPDDEIPAPPPAPIPDDDTSAPPPPAPIPDGGDTSAPPPAPIPDNITSAPPSPPPSPPPPFTFRPRFGRGGRIIFDRSDPLMLSPPDCGESSYVAPRPRRSAFP